MGYSYDCNEFFFWGFFCSSFFGSSRVGCFADWPRFSFFGASFVREVSVFLFLRLDLGGWVTAFSSIR